MCLFPVFVLFLPWTDNPAAHLVHRISPLFTTQGLLLSDELQSIPCLRKQLKEGRAHFGLWFEMQCNVLGEVMATGTGDEQSVILYSQSGSREGEEEGREKRGGKLPLH